MIDRVFEIAQGAGQLIMEIYNSVEDGSLEVQNKSDNSPLTKADLASQGYICQNLEQFEIPIVAEEAPVAYSERRDWKRFWLVDPLDGTKEFIKRNGEFTVNIGLVEDGSPVLGVIWIPAQQVGYMAAKNEGAYRLDQNGRTEIKNVRNSSKLVAVESRSHPSPAIEKFYEQNSIQEVIKCGSSIKFCRLAEGQADVYARFTGSSEWDTAAGQCILEESGCRLIDLKTGARMAYNKESLINNHFLATREGLELEL